jgi:hypothetical protein
MCFLLLLLPLLTLYVAITNSGVFKAVNNKDSQPYSNILIYVEQDATLHSLFYLETARHVSSGTSTHHQERKQLYLQHLLFVRPLLLPAASGR